MQNAYVQILHFIFLIQDNTNLLVDDQTNADSDQSRHNARREAIDFASKSTNKNQIIDRLLELSQRIRDAMINFK